MKCTTTAMIIWQCLFLSVTILHADEGSDQASKELEKFAGKWQCIAGVHGDQKMSAEVAKQIKMEFSGDKMTLSAPAKQTKFTIKVDPTKKPMVFAMTALDGTHEGRSAQGIYRWEDGKFQLCIPNRPTDKEGPPKDFDTSGHRDLALLTFEKVKSGSDEKPDK